MKLSKHARIELLILSGLALGSCDMPQAFRASDAERLEMADINARRAIARMPEIIDRLDRIEQRLDMQ